MASPRLSLRDMNANMQFMKLPLDVVSAVVDQTVISSDLFDELQLRLVNRGFLH